MHEIFISYSSLHRDLTRGLVTVLEAQYGAGSVWWDHELEARTSYATQIRAALERSRVVVVIWTAGAWTSDYVYAEAQRALESGKLVNVRPRELSFRAIPEPFNIHHIDAAEDHDAILATVAKVWHGVPIPTRVPLHEIWYRQHGRRLLDPRQDRLPDKFGPVMLLQAKYGIVPYVDVTGAAAELVAWCVADPRPATGRLVHGLGGLGKTRLLIDVVAKLGDRGWAAGFLDRADGLDEPTRRQRWQALEQLVDHGDDMGLLLVLDYAEGRSGEVAALARRIAERSPAARRTVRLVLLARGAGEWWDRLVSEQPELDALSDAVALASIPDRGQRLALFRTSLDAFAKYGWPRPDAAPPAELEARIAAAEDFERPLAVQMAALLWLAAATPGGVGGGIDRLLDRILGLERAHWAKLLGVLGDDRIRDLSRGIGGITLVQGVESSKAAERLLMADCFYGEAPRARAAIDPLIRDLGRLYGRSVGIGAVEPDLIGEHLATGDRIGDADLVAACISWVTEQPGPRRAGHRRDLLTVLQRATSSDHGAKAVQRAEGMLGVIVAKHIGVFASELIQVMIETPGNLSAILARAVDGLAEGNLAALDAELPFQSLTLMDLSLRVVDRRTDVARALLTAVDAAPETATDGGQNLLAHLAGLLAKLTIRFANLGRREEALATSLEAVGICRQLVAARPDAFLPDLAGTLHHLGAMLANLGRREEALVASQEALELYQQLAAARPDMYLPKLAGSLNNLSIRLVNLGRREEALAAVQEAVDIRRRLAAGRPDDFLPDLAMSLNNLGAMLSNLGRCQEALATGREATEFYRKLATAKPDAFLPDLAMSLNNLSIRLSDLGRREEALAASQEATAIRRQLAAARPDTFVAELAHSLNNLGGDLARLGRWEEALAASGEALKLYRDLAAARPGAFLPDLAMSLTNLGGDLARLGRREQALAAGQEAVRLYRELAATQPDAFLPNLASSLGALSQTLGAMRRAAEAAQAAGEGLAIIAPLLAHHPAAFGQLAHVLSSDLIAHSQAAGIAPDRALLECVARMLGAADGES